MTASMITARIEKAGDRGDGQITLDGKTVHVPFSLPGETVQLFVKGSFGHVEDIIEESPERAEPPCPHFKSCGGCSLQHMSDDAYRRFKTSRIETALARSDIPVPEFTLQPGAPRSRRRVTLTAMRGPGGFEAGFLRRRSRDLKPVRDCLIATDAINAVLPRLAPVLNGLRLKKEIRLTLTDTQTGIDAAIHEKAEVSGAQAAGRLADNCRKAGLARLTAAGETLFEDRAPELPMGRAKLVPPPGGFLQATMAAEHHLADFVLSGIDSKKAKKALDLYAGAGTFALRIAEKLTVHAVEFDKAALNALETATRFAQKLKPVTIEARDLEKRPVEAKELSKYDIVILDPPRAGAARQAAELSRSSVPTVIYVSCDPGTFARDARQLIDGGYALAEFTAVDQFLWSHHVEVAARFVRRK